MFVYSRLCSRIKLCWLTQARLSEDGHGKGAVEDIYGMRGLVYGPAPGEERNDVTVKI